MLAKLPKLGRVRRVLATARRAWGSVYYDRVIAAMSTGRDIHEVKNAVPAIFLFGMASVELLKRGKNDLRGIVDCISGHSIGELAALVACGAVHLQDMLKYIRIKTEIIQEMSFTPPCSVLVVFADREQVQALISKHNGINMTCWVANVNAPKQTVVSGHEETLQALQIILKKQHIKTRTLPTIPIPVHSPLMEPLATSMAEHTKKIPVSKPAIPYVSSIAGEVKDTTTVHRILPRIAVDPVDWPRAVEIMLNNLGIKRFLACGPGTTAKGLVNANLADPDSTRIIQLDMPILRTTGAAGNMCHTPR